MIYPHAGDAVVAGINKTAFAYNITLRTADVESDLPDFGDLWLQSVKLSENGKFIVVRLCEQNGARGTVNLGEDVALLNMLEDEIGNTDKIDYSPFEIITLGLRM